MGDVEHTPLTLPLPPSHMAVPGLVRVGAVCTVAEERAAGSQEGHCGSGGAGAAVAGRVWGLKPC